ncbi:MAG: adenylosuccinate synthetase [Planctomycetes bacterium SM23_65]|nr:MAG: adenylosuccinate synthetase [Planctomycetes bacterium SM23_65]
MPSVVVVGAQWGDEAKAKVVDLLSEEADVVVRSQGGNNAGHTVVVGDDKFIMHLIPCGVLRPGVMSVIGNGVVVDPRYFLEELEGLRDRGVTVTPENLLLSERAHLIMPYHRLLDTLSDGLKAGEKIGTTGRGIGPCYADKMARSGLRVVDLRDEKTFRARLELALLEKNVLLQKLYDHEPLSADAIAGEYRGYAKEIAGFVGDTEFYLSRARTEGKRILFEAAQGTLLDIDHGTYPYVTSSNAAVYGACSGSATSPKGIDKIIGVLKAYTTRVGSGPFPTELSGELGERLRENGQEFGATTGRPRRCGWLDAVAGRYVARLNGFDAIAVTKIDVLSGLEKLRVCTTYRIDGEVVNEFPSSASVLAKVEGVYEELPGWQEDISGARSMTELPEATQDYIHYIEEIMSAPVEIVSVGPEREQTIRRGREGR